MINVDEKIKSPYFATLEYVQSMFIELKLNFDVRRTVDRIFYVVNT